MLADLSDTTEIYKCSLTLQDLSKILLAYPKISRSCLQDLSLGQLLATNLTNGLIETNEQFNNHSDFSLDTFQTDESDEILSDKTKLNRR